VDPTREHDIVLHGATGFVGSAVARRLALDGTPVRALVRAGSPRFHLDGLDLEFVSGDLRDARSLRAAMAGIRHVTGRGSPLGLLTRALSPCDVLG